MLLALTTLQITAKAQDNEACIKRILAQKGNWGQFKNPVSVTGTDLDIQKKFLLAVHQMIQARYIPMGVNPKFSYVHPPSQKNWPVNAYTYNVDMPHYVCKGDELSFPSSVGIALDISFNQFSETSLYDTTDDVQLTGYLDLRHGWPIEVKPGIWQFPDDQESLGFGITGKSKLWLISFDGKLPWAYVTQKEFLEKRKYNLQRQLADQDSRLKEQLEKWETEKKYSEQQLKNDATKLTKYIDNTYKPAIEREHQAYQRATRDLKKMIIQLEEQLANGGEALNQPAIVKQNPKNSLEYLFTDKGDPFAQILTKPNPAYFNRNLQRSAPQFISVEIIYNHQNAIHQQVVTDLTRAIDLNYLKSFIGKMAAPPMPSAPSAK